MNLVLAKRSFWIWTAVFFAVNIALVGSSGTNPKSRLAMMAGMCDGFREGRLNYRIDPFKGWTIDWAQTPDGAYYSNKAPGPALIGAPLFCVVDKLLGPPRDQHHYVYDILLSIPFQMIPFAIGAYLLMPAAASLAAWNVFLPALYFGTTASIFMNSYFGHGFAAAALLLAFAMWIRKRYAWLGFFLGWAVLGDYIVPFAFPAIGLALLWLGRQEKQNYANQAKSILWIAFGALVPALLWIQYHTHCFGGPLSLPQKFQNPEFVDLKEKKAALWGVLSAFPDPVVFLKLLFGFERGLLWTQPWIFLATIFAWTLRRERAAWIWIVGSLIGFLFLNASFGQWHAGATSGPRYLSPALPLFAYFILKFWDQWTARQRKLIAGTLVVSVLFCALVFGTTIRGELHPLWPMLLEYAWRHLGTFALRFPIAIGLPILAWWKAPQLPTGSHETV